ncbi:acetyltransferase [Vibrio inusitatus NBRC 102082]|uniref:Acetyltransferase n=1 Tax=Vibrio inusitatus NBRC 102082 TaxID=1219070 RepID=A0A4Y3HVX9_9VIBR|nr:GNAT family N-acetyltransferase [Vibrio inusitatus]GEA50912.1 acetyltransferase [Vibrio inusitatus NBRC 102082]
MTVHIRRSEPQDAKAVKAIYECTNAYRGTLQLPCPSLASWESRLSNVPENVFSYVALLDDEIVGNLGLEICTNARRRHVASFGMGVKDHYQSKGVGTALLSQVIDLADNWLNLKRLELTVFTDNEKAIGLYMKHDFIIEGESHAYAFRDGEHASVYHMARIKSELKTQVNS